MQWRALAIDGPGGSGKSTLATKLAKDLGATVISMDSFLLAPEQYRLTAIAKNYDLDRFLEEVVIPLAAGEEISYRRSDSQTSEQEVVKIPANEKIIVEGIYSFEVRFRSAYDLSIYLDASREELLRRGMSSELGGSSWLDKWDLGEQIYLEAQSPMLSTTLILDGSKTFPNGEQVLAWCEMKVRP
jgi:uridine kinase